MAIITGNIPGSTVQLFDLLDNLVATRTVAFFEPRWMEIELAEPSAGKTNPGAKAPGLKNGETYKVRILAPGSPVEFLGTAKIRGQFPATIFLYRGKAAEGRQHPRFAIHSTAVLESMVIHNRAYALHTPFPVKAVNISKNGIRISTAYNALTPGDCVEMGMTIGGRREKLLARVMNFFNYSQQKSEYGCRLLARSAKIERIM